MKAIKSYRAARDWPQTVRGSHTMTRDYCLKLCQERGVAIGEVSLPDGIGREAVMSYLSGADDAMSFAELRVLRDFLKDLPHS